MLKKDQKVFVRLPKEDAPPKRTLRPGVIAAVEEDRFVVQLEDACDGIEESMDAFVHFDEKRKFFQQSMKVVQKQSAEPPVFAMKLQGQAVSAESRQNYRVSCLGANVTATVGDEAGCAVVDLSATGLAFYSHEAREAGQQVRIKLSHGGKEYSGRATIQSVRKINPRQTRYGVHCIEDKKDNLASSLSSINAAIQSEQLRRLAGND